MTQILDYLFGAASFMPHGVCLSWRPDLVAMHAVSDAVIFLAYSSIPLALYVFLQKRRDLEFKNVFFLFVAFIFACGLTHLGNLITLWQPVYGIQGMIKVVTALVSVATAAILWPLIPKAIALPSPAALRLANAQLAREVASHSETEEQLREARDELEERVNQRTKELAASNAALEQSNFDLRNFALRISHDLRNPLSVIKGRSELIETMADRVPPELIEHIHAVRRGTDRIDDMINGLYSFSAIGAELQDEQTFQLNEAAEDAVENLSTQISDANAKVTITQDMPTFSGSRPLITLLFQNLIGNAIKYAADKPAKVEISAATKNGHIQVSLKDNGIGISEAYRETVFTMFRRAPETEDIGGTGIGLATCRRIVEMHNGKIWNEPNPTGGTIFHFTLRQAAH